MAIKQMRFKKWAIINHGGAICGVLVTIALSFFMRDVWALVVGYCSESASRCILSYIICPYLPPAKWDRDAIRDLFRFSRSLFGLSILNLIFARTDVFVLGKMRSASDLGLYTMAIYLVQTPASFVMNVLGQQILPTLSQIQENNNRMNPEHTSPGDIHPGSDWHAGTGVFLFFVHPPFLRLLTATFIVLALRL